MSQISMKGKMGISMGNTNSSFAGCGVKWVTAQGKMGYFTF